MLRHHIPPILRHPTRLFIVCAAITFATTSSSALDPFNYAVPVEGFNPRVYQDETSLFRCASSGEFSLIETPWQKVVRTMREKDMTIIEIRTGERGQRSGCGDTGTCLSDTRFLNLSHPDISRIADQFSHASRPIEEVERFVHDRITNKTTGIPLIPAPDVFRVRRGDCTEHTVLAVAILRRMGIPARAVIGMYLAERFNEARDSFVFHMWAEACHGGAWHIVDATRPGQHAANRYIAFAYHNLARLW